MQKSYQSISNKKSCKIIFLCLIFLCSLCRKNSPEESKKNQLIVSAAISLLEVFGEFERSFEAEHPGVNVVMNFAGSQILAGQLVAGAEADLFVSANQKQMQRVIEANRANTAEIIAYNQLVLITPADNPKNINHEKDLIKPGVRIVLADAEVPAGDYARRLLQEQAILPQVLVNVVSNEEDVRGVVAKISLGEADAGIVYATDVTPSLRDKVHKVLTFHSQLEAPSYEIAVIVDSPKIELAQNFMNSLKTQQAAQVWRKFGFNPP